MGPRIGRYEVLTTLGKGGMGEVFLAQLRGPRAFRKQFAIKRLRRDVDDPATLERFAREAQIAAWLSHPAVCQVYELGEDEAGPFIVMEYLEGTTLAAVIRRVRATRATLPLPVVLHVIDQVAAGLAAAHVLVDEYGAALGLVHRDVSPTNVIITRDGRVKLLDFGVAKVDHVRTQTGIVRGKYAYMSPEQIAGGDIDRRTDLFALGAVLFELLTGRALFAAGSLAATAEAILHRPLPDVRRLRPDVPEPVAAVLRRALARSRGERYTSADELRAALAGATAARPATPAELARWAAWAAGDDHMRSSTDEDATLDDRAKVAPDVARDDWGDLDLAPTLVYTSPSPSPLPANAC